MLRVSFLVSLWLQTFFSSKKEKKKKRFYPCVSLDIKEALWSPQNRTCFPSTLFSMSVTRLRCHKSVVSLFPTPLPPPSHFLPCPLNVSGFTFQTRKKEGNSIQWWWGKILDGLWPGSQSFSLRQSLFSSTVCSFVLKAKYFISFECRGLYCLSLETKIVN